MMKDLLKITMTFTSSHRELEPAVFEKYIEAVDLLHSNDEAFMLFQLQNMPAIKTILDEFDNSSVIYDVDFLIESIPAYSFIQHYADLIPKPQDLPKPNDKTDELFYQELSAIVNYIKRQSLEGKNRINYKLNADNIDIYHSIALELEQKGYEVYLDNKTLVVTWEQED